MTVIKVTHRACKPEEFLFQFKLVCLWSLPSLPWENPPDAWMVQHLGCADRLTLSWKARAKPCLPLAVAGGAVRWAQDSAAVSIRPGSRGFRQGFCRRQQRLSAGLGFQQYCGIRSFHPIRGQKDLELLIFPSQTAGYQAALLL